MSDVLGTIAQGVNPLVQANQAMQVRATQQQIANAQQQLQANQFALQQAKLQPVYASMMALNPDTATLGDVQQALGQSARLGGETDGAIANLNEMMANGGKVGDYVRSMRIRGMPAWEQFGVSNLTAEQLNQQMLIPDPTGQGRGPISVSLGYAIQHGLWDPGTRGIGSGISGVGAPGGGGASGTGAPATPTPPAASKQAFVQSFGPTAQRIAQATGLPVNYVMAQAGLETGWGTSGHYQNNNFFGISPGGTVASYPTPDAGADAYINLVNNDPRYAKLSRTGTLQEIGDRFAQAGYNPMVPGAAGGPSYGARIQSFGAGLPEPGSYQVASTAPTGPPATAPAAPAAPDFYGQTGGVIRGAPAGTAEMIGGATKRAQDLISSQTQTLATRAILAGMETDLNTRGFVSGTGSSSYGTMRQLLVNAGVTPENVDIKQGQAAQEQFAKFSYQLQAQQMAALGAPSDARQEMSEASNPSPHLSQAGNLKIVHMLMGNQQAIDVMSRAFQAAQASGQATPGGFDNWRQGFTAKDKATGGEFDPRVFWMANMPPKDQIEYKANTAKNPREWEQLSNNLEYAARQGWISQNPDGSIGSNW